MQLFVKTETGSFPCPASMLKGEQSEDGFKPDIAATQKAVIASGLFGESATVITEEENETFQAEISENKKADLEKIEKLEEDPKNKKKRQELRKKAKQAQEDLEILGYETTEEAIVDLAKRLAKLEGK